MEWDKVRVPQEELAKVNIRVPTPEQQRARLRHMLGIREATFLGKRNHSKIRVFILLLNNQGRFLSSSEISEASGISYDYCRNRLRYWVKWGYLKSYLQKTKFDRARKYAISKKGIRYLERVPAQITSQILKELQDYQTMAEKVKRTLKD